MTSDRRSWIKSVLAMFGSLPFVIKSEASEFDELGLQFRGHHDFSGRFTTSLPIGTQTTIAADMRGVINRVIIDESKYPVLEVSAVPSDSA